MAPDDASGGRSRLRVSVAYSPRARVVDEVEVELPEGSKVADALSASGLAERYPWLVLETVAIGVWGSFCAASDLLRDRDRVEVYRPLLVDPKEARRLRYREGRAKGGGKGASK